jgi:hypothetical protein
MIATTATKATTSMLLMVHISAPVLVSDTCLHAAVRAAAGGVPGTKASTTAISCREQDAF